LTFIAHNERVNVRHVTPILNVSDIEASFAWFEKLGWERVFRYENGGFGAVGAGDAEIFLCEGAQGSRGTKKPKHPGDDETDGVWMSWWLESPAAVDEAHARAQAQGLEISWPPTDEPWGVREFHLRHPDGHTFRVSASLNE
jgi:catechol 2,3-dioxygenase-like lactoylglutathione lyase family enzyme